MTKDLIRLNTANIVSGIALLFTWLAIIYLLKDKFYFSFGLILLALVFDALDGYLARRLTINNQLGRVLDGYVDTVNYLIYPSLAFVMFFKLDSIFSIVSIFIFIAAGIFRLARFEVRGIKKVEGKMYYEGLPVFISPVLVLLFLLTSQLINTQIFLLFSTVLLIVTSVLMVQTFRFPKPKNVFPVLFIILILSFFFLSKG